MTKKPEHSRPFNLEHAKAGAPFCGSDGQSIKVLTWDRRHPTHPIIAIEEDGDQEAIAFRADGSAAHGHAYICHHLVMLPLGFIDDKPVFAGDEIMDCEVLTTVSATPGDHDFKYCTWPVPEPVYPVTRLDDTQLHSIAHKYGNGYTSAMRAVANAAIARAIEDGDVVLPGSAPSEDLLMKVAKEVYCRATGQEHFLDEKEEYFRAIIASITGAKDAKEGAK